MQKRQWQGFPQFVVPAHIQADNVPSGRYDYLRAYNGICNKCTLEFIPEVGCDSARISIPAAAMTRMALSWLWFQITEKRPLWLQSLMMDGQPPDLAAFEVTQALPFARQYTLYGQVYPDSLKERPGYGTFLVERINLHLGTPTFESECFLNVHRLTQESLSIQLDLYLSDGVNYHAGLLPMLTELGTQKLQTIEQICEVLEVYGFTPHAD